MKSAEDAARKAFATEPRCCKICHRKSFVAGVAYQRERESLLVEALEAIVAGLSEHGPRVIARAALLKYREGVK